jgi:methylated-DNA-[protein]-cysteine S-methyltransferase
MQNQLAVFESSFGWCAIVGSGECLRRLTFGHRTAAGAIAWLDDPALAGAGSRDWNQPLIDRIVAMLDGNRDELRDVIVDLDHLAPFARCVVSACRRIGWGKTRSYGEIAAAASAPGAARAVGRVMAENRIPLVIPCHRVIATGGGLGGYSAPQGLTTKRRLLALESAEHACWQPKTAALLA